MVDPFATLRPSALFRFTCWSQYQNGRYSNYGRRIDFTLLDRTLFEAHARTGGPLAEDEDEAGALRAATAGARWQPAPLRGARSYHAPVWRRGRVGGVVEGCGIGDSWESGRGEAIDTRVAQCFGKRSGGEER